MRVSDNYKFKKFFNLYRNSYLSLMGFIPARKDLDIE